MAKPILFCFVGPRDPGFRSEWLAFDLGAPVSGREKKKTKQETGVVGRINGSADTDTDADTPGVVFVASWTDSCSDQLIFRDELLMLQKIAPGFLN